MGDIYISGNGKRPQDTQDIPITPRRVDINDLGAQNRNAQQPQRRGQQPDPRREQRRPNPDKQPQRSSNGGQHGEEPARKKPKKKSQYSGQKINSLSEI